MSRQIVHVYQASPKQDGEGVDLKRLTFFNGKTDPFLMIDELKAGPNETLKGFPPHPHRGIQTLTYLIKGGMRHKDSLGNQGHISAGQMQWMDSGQGIVHSEQPYSDENGLWGYQLWLNLPHAQKFVPPRYLDISRDSYQLYQTNSIKFVALAGHWVVEQQKISAEFDQLSGQAGVADLQLQAQHQLALSCSSATLLLYVIQGAISVGEQVVEAGYLAQLCKGGDDVLISAPSLDARVLCLHGTPIGEPIVHQGPFVMNTQQELQETISAYQAGKLGVLE